MAIFHLRYSENDDYLSGHSTKSKIIHERLRHQHRFRKVEYLRAHPKLSSVRPYYQRGSCYYFTANFYPKHFS